MNMIKSHRISFDDEQIAFILEHTEKTLRSGNVVLGSYLEEFEDAYAGYCGRNYGIGVGSDTAAFEMQLKILGVKNRVVLYPALGFPSILEAVFNAGGRPYFLDSDPQGHLFCSADAVLEAIIDVIHATGEPPKAIILMHTGGYLARWSKEIEDVCRDYGVTVLEDAAHCFGAVLDGNVAGSFGFASAFSLYATKPMHSCEGGMIVTDDAGFAEEAKIYRNYGRVQNFGRSRIIRHGYSWRMPEFNAIVGLANLDKIDENIKRRREIMAKYDELLAEEFETGSVEKLFTTPGMEPCGYRYILQLPQQNEAWSAELDVEYRNRRAAIKQFMLSKGVDLPGEVYELPSHEQPIWSEYGDVSAPHAEEFCARHFALPVYPLLTDSDLEQTVNALVEGLATT